MNGRQRKPAPWLFLLCWGTYVSAYMSRVNFSSAMDKLEGAFDADAEILGVIGGAFFLAYAIGQLVNGFLGDRIPPDKFVCTALLGTTVVNFSLAASGGYWMVLVLWCLNGCFQSMFYGPLMRMLSLRYPPSMKSTLSTGMTSAIMIGYMLTWTVLGRLLLGSIWRAYFFLPAVVTGGMLLLWLAVRRCPGVRAMTAPEKPPVSPPRLREVLRNIIRCRLWLFALVCFCLGMAKESVSLWAPILLTRLLHVEAAQSPVYLLLFPLMNLLGILAAGWLVRRCGERIRFPLLGLFAAAAACALLLILPGIPGALAVLLMAAFSALFYGCQNILLGVVPLAFARTGMLSTLVGIFDFSSYAGAALSSVLLSLLLTGGGSMGQIALYWMVIAALAGLFSAAVRLHMPE